MNEHQQKEDEWVSCPICKGIGQIKGKDCDECNGVGQVKKEKRKDKI